MVVHIHFWMDAIVSSSMSSLMLLPCAKIDLTDAEFSFGQFEFLSNVIKPGWLIYSMKKGKTMEKEPYQLGFLQ